MPSISNINYPQFTGQALQISKLMMPLRSRLLTFQRKNLVLKKEKMVSKPHKSQSTVAISLFMVMHMIETSAI